MSPRLDLPIAVLVWVAGFLWVGRSGSWTPLAVMAIAGALRLIVGDPETRRLLRPRLSTTAWGLLAGAMMIAATYGLYGPIARLLPRLPEETSRLYSLLYTESYRGASLAIVIGAIAASEEIVWRGRVLSSGADTTRPGWPSGGQLLGILGKMIVYGVAHAPSGSAVLVGVAFLCGVYWSALRVVTRSLWASIVAHVLWDLTVMVAHPLG